MSNDVAPIDIYIQNLYTRFMGRVEGEPRRAGIFNWLSEGIFRALISKTSLAQAEEQKSREQQRKDMRLQFFDLIKHSDASINEARFVLGLLGKDPNPGHQITFKPFKPETKSDTIRIRIKNRQSLREHNKLKPSAKPAV